MSTKPQCQYLSAAYAVLLKAGRSMHYSQIASVSKHLGILQSESSSLDIIMSSLLSEDIRTNPDSLFVKERPGVYALSLRGLVGSPERESRHSDGSPLLDELHVRTGITERNELINKALYLAGRTLDIAGSRGVILYRTLDQYQSIEIDISELVQEFGKHADEPAMAAVYEVPQTLRRAKQTASRLGLDDPWFATRVSLFLLELAIDLVGSETVLVIESSNSSTRIPVRLESQYASSHN